MTRRRALVTAAVMCLALLAGSFARAAQDPLKVIPKEALGFALVNRLAETDAKIQRLVKQLELPVPSPLSVFKAMADLEGVLDETGTAGTVLLPGKEAGSQPAVVVFLPVTDYKRFVERLKPEDASAKIVEAQIRDQPFVVGNRGGYALVAKESDRHALEKVLGSSKSVAADLASMRGMLAEGDVAAVVTRGGVELLSVKGQEALQEAKQALAAMPVEQKQGMEAAIGVFDIYEQILKSLGEEINSYAVAGSIDKGGNLHLLERMRVMPGRKAAKILSEVKPPQRDLLAGLPDGPFVFALAGVLPESAGECLMQFSADLMKAAPGIYGLNEKQVDELIDISRRSMKGLRAMSFMMGVGKPGDPIYSNITVVEQVDDSKAFLADYRKTIEAMNRLLKDTEGSIMTPTKLKEVEVGGISALKLTMKIPMFAGADKVPNFEEMMEKLFGPGGKMIVFMAPADEKTIVGAYTGKKLLRQGLEAAKGTRAGLAGDPQLAKTAAMLPSGAQWVGYISPKGTIDFIKRVMAAFTPEGITTPEIPDFPETPPIGFAMKTAPDGLRSHTVVPAAVLKGIAGFVTEIRKQRASPGEVGVEAADVPER